MRCSGVLALEVKGKFHVHMIGFFPLLKDNSMFASTPIHTHHRFISICEFLLVCWISDFQHDAVPFLLCLCWSSHCSIHTLSHYQHRSSRRSRRSSTCYGEEIASLQLCALLSRSISSPTTPGPHWCSPRTSPSPTPLRSPYPCSNALLVYQPLRLRQYHQECLPLRHNLSRQPSQYYTKPLHLLQFPHLRHPKPQQSRLAYPILTYPLTAHRDTLCGFNLRLYHYCVMTSFSLRRLRGVGVRAGFGGGRKSIGGMCRG